MAEPLLPALAQVRAVLLDPDGLVRAVASGRRKGAQPPWRRVELRYVDLKAGRHLQITALDQTQAHTANHPVGDAARDAVDELLDQPYGHWNLEATDETVQLQVTRKGALLHRRPRTEPVAVERDHDRDKHRLLSEDDPVYRALGLADADGRIKPTRHAKLRQVEEFLRLLDTGVTEAVDAGHLRRPTESDPLRIVDLGCGNAYLTFAAERFLTSVRGLPVRLTGVDLRPQSRAHNQQVAGELGVDADFVEGSIASAVLPDPDRPPEVVLALHACDTATDEALARAVAWDARLVLAAPCCHHDIAAQLRRAPTPSPYQMLTRQGILRERFADTLTDALRATLMRLQGYRVEVVQFVESQHTPRNTLLRATRTGRPVSGGSLRREYDDLVGAWGLTPRLAELLAGEGDAGGSARDAGVAGDAGDAVVPGHDGPDERDHGDDDPADA